MTDEIENSIAPEEAEKPASEAVTEINTDPAPTPDENKTENIAMPESAKKPFSNSSKRKICPQNRVSRGLKY